MQSFISITGNETSCSAGKRVNEERNFMLRDMRWSVLNLDEGVGNHDLIESGGCPLPCRPRA